MLARRTRGAPAGSPLHEVVNATILKFELEADGSLSLFDLSSFHRDEYAESDILLAVASALAAAADDGGIVATFNGAHFDLPVVRMRQLRWWQCEANAVARVLAGEADHVDVMLELSGNGRWPSLADACASVGFSLAGPHRPGHASFVPKETEKCENDVVGTTILMLYALAARRCSADPLRLGLPAFGRFVRSIAAGRPHLERFALSALLADDARAWGARTG